jgi:uncharacterized membrane protein YgaE (UPF0421/DUF939 family)
MVDMKQQLTALSPAKIAVGVCGAAAFVAAFYVGTSVGPFLSAVFRLMRASLGVFARLLP